jgi:hypothetical protein
MTGMKNDSSKKTNENIVPILAMKKRWVNEREKKHNSK